MQACTKIRVSCSKLPDLLFYRKDPRATKEVLTKVLASALVTYQEKDPDPFCPALHEPPLVKAFGKNKALKQKGIDLEPEILARSKAYLAKKGLTVREGPLFGPHEILRKRFAVVQKDPNRAFSRYAAEKLGENPEARLWQGSVQIELLGRPDGILINKRGQSTGTLEMKARSCSPENRKDRDTAAALVQAAACDQLRQAHETSMSRPSGDPVLVLSESFYLSETERALRIQTVQAQELDLIWTRARARLLGFAEFAFSVTQVNPHVFGDPKALWVLEDYLEFLGPWEQ